VGRILTAIALVELHVVQVVRIPAVSACPDLGHLILERDRDAVRRPHHVPRAGRRAATAVLVLVGELDAVPVAVLPEPCGALAEPS
jgi:hypothetical protein